MTSEANERDPGQSTPHVAGVDPGIDPGVERAGAVTMPVPARSAAPLEAVEGTLTRALATWAIANVALGAVVVVAGRATRRPGLVAFGRQTAAWGAVDGAIAGIGALTRRRRGELTAAERSAKGMTLRRVLVANAVADVGYVLGGVVIVLRDARGRPTLGMGRSDGVAVATQGLFLLALDLSQARRLSSRGYAR